MKTLILSLCLISSLSLAQNSIYQRAFNYYQDNAPGGVAAFGKGDSVYFKSAYGLANLEVGKKIDFSTPFNVASVSKEFTCFAISLLEQDGKLNWEDDIRKHIPELPFYGDTIKLKHCAQHTSGLRDLYILSTLKGIANDSLTTHEFALDLIFSQKRKSFKAGEYFDYNASGYVLLAEVVNRLSPDGFTLFLKDRVFSPIGMKNAFVGNLKNIKSDTVRALSYERISSDAKTFKVDDRVLGPSNVYLSINDAIKWLQYQMNPSPEHKSIFEKMTTWGKLNNGKSIDYGYGFSKEREYGKEVIGHHGVTMGFHSIIFYYPSSKIFVSVITNSNAAGKMYDATKMVMDSIILGEVAPVSNWVFDTADYDIKHITELELKKYVGDFNVSFNKQVETYIDDGQLYFYTTWGCSLPLYYLGNHKFAYEYGELWFSFKNDKLNKIIVPQKFYKTKGKVIDYSKIAGVKSSEIIGTYFNKEFNATLEVKTENEKLVVFHEIYGTTDLKQRKKLVFGCNPGWLRNFTFIKKKGKIIGFELPIGRLNDKTFFKKQN